MVKYLDPHGTIASGQGQHDITVTQDKKKLKKEMTKKDPQIVSSHRIHKKTTKTKKKMTKKDPQIVSSQGCGRGSIISPLHC